MGLFEPLPSFSARIAAISPQLAQALTKMAAFNNENAPWFRKSVDGTLVVDPIHLFTAIATGSDHLDPALKLEAQPIPFTQLVSFPGAKVRGKFTLTLGRPFPTVIARRGQGDAQFEIIDGEAYVAWARKLELPTANVIVLPCTVGEGRILRVRLNVNRGYQLKGRSLVAELVDALRASPALLERLTSGPKTPGHLTQRDAALHVFALGSAASVNRALAIVMGGTTSVQGPDEVQNALATFRSVKMAARGRDQFKMLRALIAHKRAIDDALARQLSVDVAELDWALARFPGATPATQSERA